MTVPDGARPVPGIAIVTSNTLEAVGLASLIHTMMPQADIRRNSPQLMTVALPITSFRPKR